MPDQNLTAEEETTLREQLASELWDDGPPADRVDAGAVTNGEGVVDGGDIWSGVNPALKAHFDQLNTKVAGFDSVVQKLSASEGRIGALQREMQKIQDAARVSTTAPTPDQLAEASKNAKEWENLKEDFPEWAGALERSTADLRQELKNEIDAIKASGQGAGISKQEVDAQISGMKREHQVDLLTLKHPDFMEVNASPEYKTWLASQPEDVRDKAVNSTSANECSSVLDSFKNSRPKKSASQIAADRQKRLVNSETVVRGNNIPVQIKSLDDMTDAQYREQIAPKIWSEK